VDDVGVPGAEVVRVIRTTIDLRGDGSVVAPFRRITQFWSFEGELLAESDPMPGRLHEDRGSDRPAVFAE
jgi:hypothetical protein